MRARLVCSLLLLAALQTACDSPESDAVVLWHAYRGDEARALEETLDAYRAQPGATPIRVVSVPYDAFANKLRVAIPRGNGPDLFIFAHDQVGDWAERGLIESLSFWVDEPLLEQFLPETLSPFVFDDAFFGLPLAFKSLALYFDTRFIKSAPKTTDDLFAAADSVRAENPDVWGLGYPVDNFYYHAIWLHGHQGRVMSSAGQPQVETAAMKQSIDFARTLTRKTGMMPPELSPALMTSLFNDHKLAFVINGPWFRGEIGAHDSWSVAPIPAVSATGESAKPYLGVEGLMMSARSERKSAAFGIMRSLTSDEAAYVRWQRARQLVANAGVYARADVREDPFSTAFRAQLTQTVPLSNGPLMRHVWAPMKSAITQSVVQGTATDSALQEAGRAIKRVTR